MMDLEARINASSRRIGSQIASKNVTKQKFQKFSMDKATKNYHKRSGKPRRHAGISLNGEK